MDRFLPVIVAENMKVYSDFLMLRQIRILKGEPPEPPDLVLPRAVYKPAPTPAPRPKIRIKGKLVLPDGE